MTDHAALARRLALLLARLPPSRMERALRLWLWLCEREATAWTLGRLEGTWRRTRSRYYQSIRGTLEEIEAQVDALRASVPGGEGAYVNIEARLTKASGGLAGVFLIEVSMIVWDTRLAGEAGWHGPLERAGRLVTRRLRAYLAEHPDLSHLPAWFLHRGAP
jgi:hypothetical protein